MPDKADVVTVSTVLTAPQVIVAMPAVLPPVTVVPLIRAMAMLLLVQVPRGAPAGMAVIVDEPPVMTEDWVNVTPVRTATGATLLDAAEAAPVPALLVAFTVQV
jgi:hypothetical protein